MLFDDKLAKLDGELKDFDVLDELLDELELVKLVAVEIDNAESDDKLLTDSLELDVDDASSSTTTMGVAMPSNREQ